MLSDPQTYSITIQFLFFLSILLSGLQPPAVMQLTFSFCFHVIASAYYIDSAPRRRGSTKPIFALHYGFTYPRRSEFLLADEVEANILNAGPSTVVNLRLPIDSMVTMLFLSGTAFSTFDCILK